MTLPTYYAAAIVLLALATAAVFGVVRGSLVSMALTMVSVVVIFASVAVLFGGGDELDLPGKA